MRLHGFLKNVVGFSISSIAAFVIGFASTPIMTRLYSPEELSRISMFLSAMGVMLVIVYFGQDQSFARYYHEVDDKNQLFSVNLSIIFVSWIITFTVTMGFVSVISEIIFSEINVPATLLCVFSTLPMAIIRMSSQLYRMQNKTKAYVVQAIALNFTTKVLVIVSAFISPDYNCYVVVYTVVAVILSVVFIAYQITRKNVSITFDIRKENIAVQFRFGFPLLVSSFAYQLYSFIPRAVLLNSETGAYEVGIYAAATSLASAINVVQAGFQTYFGAYVYETYKKDDGRINRIHHAIMFVSCSAMFVLSIFSGPIAMLLGSGYSHAARVFPILLIPPVLVNISETVVYGINIANKTALHIVIAVAAASVSYLATVVLVPTLHVVGAALGYSVASLVFYLLRSHWGLKYYAVVNSKWLTHVAIAFLFFAPLTNWYFADSFKVRHALLIASYCVLVAIYCFKFEGAIRKMVRSLRSRRS